MEKLLELIEEIKERISVLEGDEEEIDEKYEEGFDPMDWSGGNFDDAYNEGQEDGEDYIGRKSMFHSIRIIMKGIQIAEYGKIVDYGCANHYLKSVMAMEDWETIQEYFQPLYNRLKTKFRLLAPLESDERRKGR